MGTKVEVTLAVEPLSTDKIYVAAEANAVTRSDRGVVRSVAIDANRELTVCVRERTNAR